MSILDDAILMDAIELRLVTSTGEWVRGKWVETDEDPVTIDASIQPISGREIVNLPEGKRERARWTIWTLDDVGGDDEILYNDDKYEVYVATPRHEEDFIKAYLVLNNDG